MASGIEDDVWIGDRQTAALVARDVSIGFRPTLLVVGLLMAAVVVGKFLAGYAPFWFLAKKQVIGVGMIPRGEVGLTFAQMGLASEVFDAGLFRAVTLMVMVTMFLAPHLLKLLFPAVAPRPTPAASEGIEELVTEA